MTMNDVMTADARYVCSSWASCENFLISGRTAQYDVDHPMSSHRLRCVEPVGYYESAVAASDTSQKQETNISRK